MTDQEYGAWIIRRTQELMMQYGYGWSKAMALAADEAKERFSHATK